MSSTNVRERTTMEEVRDQVQQDDLGKWDVTAKRDDVRFIDGNLRVPTNSGVLPLGLTRWATSQLCGRLNIPAAYFMRCPGELQEAQADYWLRNGEHKPDEQWLLRAKDSKVRGILSDQYSPLDNAALMDEVRRLLPARYRVDWFGLKDEALHLRVVDPTRYREVLPDDSLTVGIHISNSEVGRRSVRVDALVYRLVCTNGLIRLVQGKSLMHQRHLHIRETRFSNALADAIKGAISESESFLQQMQTATKTPITDVEDAIERISDRWNLSDETQKLVEQNLAQESPRQQETLYGLVNAFTSVARSMSDEQRYDLEVLAGQLAAHGVNAYAPRRRRHHGDTVATMEPSLNGLHSRQLPPNQAMSEVSV